MANNQYVNKVELGDQTLMDITDTTATAADVAQGKTFYGANGARLTGTNTGGGGALCILVTAPTGSTVTAEKDGSTYTADESAETPGTWEIGVPEYGTYTVTATLGDDTSSASVTVSEESVMLAYFSATINITAPTGSTVSVKLNGETVNTHTATGITVAVTVYQAGSYTVTAKAGNTDSQNVIISTDGQTASVTLRVIPTSYTQLEYIESTKTQWINTELSMPAGWRVVGDCLWPSVDSNLQGIFGLYESEVSQYGRSWFGREGNAWTIASAGYAAGGTISANVRYGFDVQNSQLPATIKINGNSIATAMRDGSFKSTRSSKQIPLFTIALNGYYTSWIASVRLYDRITFYDQDDNMVAQFIPVKQNSDERIGMYDVVRNKFFTNNGTGVFTAGPEVA